jgi:D-alanyl-D-alanine carboxypeptidase/D-alanyl-D-alanine-endopeptidase (penicillin-binding protein 4)
VRSAIGATLSSRLKSGGALVVDPATGTVLYESAATTPLTPASNVKLATAAAALSVLGPTHRIPTTVVVSDRDVYLVGGGDPTLASASSIPGTPTLRDLADATVRQVGAGTALRLHYDDSLFTGPTLARGWSSSYPAVGEVAPVTALMVDQGRRTPSSRSRVKDPARQAARQFAQLLRNGGVTVSSLDRATAPGDATVIAKVESPAVSSIVQTMLTDSENTYAEALGHLVGKAGVGEASFDGGARATRDALSSLGFDVSGYRLADASGLSSDNRLTARTLAGILTGVVRGEHPQIASIASGLPVAGFTGTLADRYVTPATQAGRGFVHAKTGTLTGVVAESGIVLDATGRQIVFSFLATGVRSLDGMRRTLDGVASTLASCGCTS